MSRAPLTEIAIRSLRVIPGERVELWDGKIPGFGVRVSATGCKSFVLLYRSGGRPRRLTLGRYPVLGLAEARQLARDALNKVAHGNEPQRGKAVTRNSRGFLGMVDEFLKGYAERHTRVSTQEQSRRVLVGRFGRTWGRRDISEITKLDVLHVLDAIVAEGKPMAANNALAVVRKFFNWCVERGAITSNPCTGVKRPSKPKSRSRTLDHNELARVWNGAGRAGFPFGRIVQLLIVTAQRRNEVAGMRWSHLDLDKTIWSLPPEATKNGREHIVPLSSAAVTIIRSLPRVDDELVFPSQRGGGRAFSGFGKSKARLDRVAGVEDWTLHDLRRSAATMMAEMGTAPHVLERILNHVSGTVSGVAAVYNRFSYLPEMRVALEKWSDVVVAAGRQHESVSRFVAAGRGEA